MNLHVSMAHRANLDEPHVTSFMPNSKAARSPFAHTHSDPVHDPPQTGLRVSLELSLSVSHTSKERGSKEKCPSPPHFEVNLSHFLPFFEVNLSHFYRSLK